MNFKGNGKRRGRYGKQEKGKEKEGLGRRRNYHIKQS
jgi:hypothetical protein